MNDAIYMDREPLNTQLMLDEENPWPALAAFPEEAERFFNGRDDESEELSRRVLQYKLTILFGRSGLGKTSLLQAGLFPRLRPRYILPVYISFDYTDSSPPLLEQVTERFRQEIAARGITAPESPKR